MRPLTLAIALLLCGCDRNAAPATSGDTAQPDTIATAPVLVDSSIPPAIAGEEGWNYHQSADVDLTNDGRPERVVLTARVELYRGRPAWDDGQPWQVYIESPDGGRTYVYAQRLQLGTLTMRVSRGEQGLPSSIVLLEQLPSLMSVYEAWFTPDGSLTTATRFQRELDPVGQTAAPTLP
jgi:hypothetical protein